MRDYSGYIIAVLFVGFVMIVATYDQALQFSLVRYRALVTANESLVQKNRELNLLLAAESARASVVCVTPARPTRRVVLPTFGGGSTTRYR